MIVVVEWSCVALVWLLALVTNPMRIGVSAQPVAPPVTSGCYVRYSAEVAPTASSWSDLSGNNRHASISGSTAIARTIVDGRYALSALSRH